VETSLEDIAEANTLMKGVLLKKADELGYAARNFLEQVKEHVKHGKQKSFLNKALREALKINPSSYKMYMSELISYGYVRRTAQGNQKQGYRYEVVDYREYEQLQSRINTALDEALDKLTKQVNGKRKS
jgi:predicted transcriptional regulator